MILRMVIENKETGETKTVEHQEENLDLTKITSIFKLVKFQHDFNRKLKPYKNGKWRILKVETDNSTLLFFIEEWKKRENKNFLTELVEL